MPNNKPSSIMVKNIRAILLVGTAGEGFAETAPWEVTGNVVITHQSTSESHIENEYAGSGDLVIQHEHGSGNWLAHIEISSTPKSGRVSAILPEANADVGSALDEDSEGRLQLSELFYTHDFTGDWALSAGLIDVSGFFEQSRLASDETIQFLGAFFVGNPTIEFPDYTLGIVYEAGLPHDVVLRAALASSDGLADNPERSYSQLLTVEDGEGVFGITSASWEAKRWLLRAGAWLNTADDQTLDTTSDNKSNYGAYILAGYTQGQHSTNIRLGAANPEVSQAAGFASVAYRYQRGRYTAGTAIGRAFLSSQEPSASLDDTDQYELFLRYTLGKDLFFTGDLQRIKNSNYGALPENRNQHATIYGVRLTWLYE
jgi:hypothetical protein